MRLLDLFCGAGGCSAGYAHAGFDVVGVDVEPQHSYPFLDVIQADALDVLADVEYCRGFDLIHASPPCQDYSRALRHMALPKPRLIGRVRAALKATGVPWVIENVPGAPMPAAVQVCGFELGLRVQRHRLFESSLPILGTPCDDRYRVAMNPHAASGRALIYAEFGRGDPEPHWRRAMGVEWMGRYEAREAIPPAYTEFIGRQLAAALAPVS